MEDIVINQVWTKGQVLLTLHGLLAGIGMGAAVGMALRTLCLLKEHNGMRVNLGWVSLLGVGMMFMQLISVRVDITPGSLLGISTAVGMACTVAATGLYALYDIGRTRD